MHQFEFLVFLLLSILTSMTSMIVIQAQGSGTKQNYVHRNHWEFLWKKKQFGNSERMKLLNESYPRTISKYSFPFERCKLQSVANRNAHATKTNKEYKAI